MSTSPAEHLARIEEIAENRLLGIWAETLPRATGQIGEIHAYDSELIPVAGDMLLASTVDMVVEEIRLGFYADPFTIGRIAVITSLSDLAAVGAEPLGMKLIAGLANSSDYDYTRKLAQGIADACQSGGLNIGILGGDTNDTEEMCIGTVGLGLVRRDEALSRIGANVGDYVYVSGPVGLGAALVAAKMLGVPSDVFNESDYRPEPRIREARTLRKLASACMDTSDGLLPTIDQLARLNDVGMAITAPPGHVLHPKAEAVQRHLNMNEFPFLAGLHGEFELAFCVPQDRVDKLAIAASEIDWTPLHIGVVTENPQITINETVIDTAAVRNLMADPSDVTNIAQALLSVQI